MIINGNEYRQFPHTEPVYLYKGVEMNEYAFRHAIWKAYGDVDVEVLQISLFGRAVDIFVLQGIVTNIGDKLLCDAFDHEWEDCYGELRCTKCGLIIPITGTVK